MKYKLQRKVIDTGFWFVRRQARLGKWYLKKVHNLRVRLWEYHECVNIEHGIHQ